jgi:hypothetical protein
MFRFVVVLALSLGLAACAASKYQDAPTGIGSGPNDLKKSPCACMTLPNGPSNDLLNEPTG